MLRLNPVELFLLLLLRYNVGFTMNSKLTWKGWIAVMTHPTYTLRLFLWVVVNPLSLCLLF